VQGGFRDLALLAQIDRLKRITKGISRVGPYLDKDDRVALQRDQVNFAEGRAVILGEDSIALGRKKFFRLSLSLLSAFASFSAYLHGSKVTEGAPRDQDPRVIPFSRLIRSVESLRTLCHTTEHVIDLGSDSGMRISREQVQRVAQLARLDLTAEEETELIEHFDKVLTYMGKLNQLNTDNVEPTAHAVEVPGPLREDQVTNQADTDALLQNAPGRENDFFRVPKIIK